MIDVDRIDRALDELDSGIKSLKDIDTVKKKTESLIQDISKEKNELSALKQDIDAYFIDIQSENEKLKQSLMESFSSIEKRNDAFKKDVDERLHTCSEDIRSSNERLVKLSDRMAELERDMGSIMNRVDDIVKEMGETENKLSDEVRNNREKLERKISIGLSELKDELNQDVDSKIRNVDTNLTNKLIEEDSNIKRKTIIAYAIASIGIIIGIIGIIV